MAASRHNEMMLNCLLGEEVEKRFDMWGRRSHVTRPGTGGWWRRRRRRRRRGWGLGAAFDRSSIILHSHHNNGLVAISNLKISDSFGYTLYTKENATKGKFSFTTENPDQFDICFKSRSRMASGRAPDQLVKLNMKHGVEAKTYEEIEKVEKLTPLEAQLRHLEHLSQSIADNFN